MNFSRSKDAFGTEAATLLATRDGMDWEAFDRAVCLLASAPRIATTGCGHSGIACAHLAHLLCCIERPARFLSPSEAVHGGMGFLQPGDVLVWASRGGQTDELLPICRICRDRSVPIIGVTENRSSPLSRLADILLPIHVTAETDPFNSQGTSSFTSTCAVFDALQAVLIEKTGFQNRQFAQIHPGGAVGKRLNPTE